MGVMSNRNTGGFMMMAEGQEECVSVYSKLIVRDYDMKEQRLVPLESVSLEHTTK